MFNQFLDSIESLAKMMNEIEFHDTILVSRDEQEFPVHRNILAVRSNVFKDSSSEVCIFFNFFHLNEINSGTFRKLEM
jgi:hypothetical protein